MPIITCASSAANCKRFKLARRSSITISKSDVRQASAMGNPKILLVEDDLDLLHSMHERLKAHHYEVACASDAIACMSEARRFEPDLIILDLGLPAGDGFMLMERFKRIASLAATPVIVVTGQDPRACRHRMLEAGARSVMQKPVDNAVLLATIQKVLGKNPRVDEPAVYNLEHP